MGKNKEKLSKWEVFENEFKSFGILYFIYFIIIMSLVLLLSLLLLAYSYICPEKTLEIIFSFFGFSILFLVFLNSKSNNTLLNKQRRIKYYLLGNYFLYLIFFSFNGLIIEIFRRNYFNKENWILYLSFTIEVISIIFYIILFFIFLTYIYNDKKNFEN